MAIKAKQKSSLSPFVKSRVGLHISDRSVRFVELLGRKNIRLGRFGEINIPAGVIVGGEVKNPDKLARVLSILRKDIGIK